MVTETDAKINSLYSNFAGLIFEIAFFSWLTELAMCKGRVSGISVVLIWVWMLDTLLDLHKPQFPQV